ncbi:beta-ketoacyl-ACP synthase III [Desulfonatronovibrio hydrogenovorans]|uniref:beta-ketoacyl-ACP synthase III n=1 Tax=Desulfonatronovibrio hydrogenovorans TaxID=53245 RepID=UPI00048C06FB|nr:beta-ketoacyl-ACP synthase III [Desulfonatronovibrio hydrogenovorans]
MTNSSFLAGFSFYVPDKILTNKDFEKLVDTSDEWITSRTGISNRHIVEDEACSDLASAASRQAIARSGLVPGDLTHIINATFTPDAFVPNAACVLMEKLDIKGIPAMDVNAACTGFIYGMELARGLCSLHPEAKVLLTASEVVSSRVNLMDRSTGVLFGDGAGACIVSAMPFPANVRSGQILDVILRADGSLSNLLTVKAGGSAHPLRLNDRVGEDFFVQMEGREVFKHAVRSMQGVCLEILKRNNLQPEDIDLFIPHQANIRIIEALAKKMMIQEDKLYINVQDYGNTSAASTPIALAEAWEKGLINSGDTVLLVAFGGGFTWGACLLRFS